MTDFNTKLHNHLCSRGNLGNPLTDKERRQLKSLLKFEAKFLPTPRQLLKIINDFKPVSQLSFWEALIETEYLTKIVLHHRRWYYRLSDETPLLDADYDKIEIRIIKLAEHFPELYSLAHPIISEVGY